MSFSEAIKWIMMIFAILGGVDAAIGNKMGLGESFKQGFMTMGALVLSMVGMNTVAPLISDKLSGVLSPVFAMVGADPSLFSGMLLANDCGGYTLAMNLCADAAVGSFSGAVVSSMMGVTMTFTIPFAFSVVKTETGRKNLSKGLLIGISTIPLGCLAGGLLCKMSFSALLFNLLPLIAMAGILIFCLLRFPKGSIAVMEVLGKILSGMLILFLLLAVLNHQFGILAWNITPFSESLSVIGDIAIVLAGAFPLLAILKKLLSNPLQRLGKRLAIQDNSVFGLFTTLVNAIPTFSDLDSMDGRGQVLNAAFAVSASFALGDHLGFTAGACPENLLPMLVGKLVGGLCAFLLALIMTREKKQA